MNKIFIDTEVTGLNPSKHDILSLAIVVVDNDKVIDFVQFNRSGDLRIDVDLLRNMPLERLHNSLINPLPEKEFKQSVTNVLTKYKNEDTYIFGYNISFDISFLKIFFKDDYYKLFSARVIDVKSILEYLVIKEKLPKNINAVNVFEQMGIGIKKEQTCLSDACATWELYKRLLEVK